MSSNDLVLCLTRRSHGIRDDEVSTLFEELIPASRERQRVGWAVKPSSGRITGGIAGLYSPAYRF